MSVNLNINTNQVFVSSSQNQILVEDRNNGTILNIKQPINKIIEITSPGPKGNKGDQGDSVFTDIGNNTFSATSSFQITGSLSVTQGVTGSFTGSFTGSLLGTASNSVNALTTSFAPNYTTTSSFNQFTQSYYQDSSSFDVRVDNLEQFSSSLDATFATDAELNQATASLSASIGVLNTNFNQFTSSYNTGSFTGSFTGDGSGLINIPASGITGLNLSQISSGSASASISPNTGLQVNVGVTAPSFTGSLFGTASNSINALTASFAPNYTTTNSFNQFTQSYNQDSSSFDTRIDSLEQFSSSLDATFATDSELNQATASLSASIAVLNSNLNQFTSSYNTGSFTGSFAGTSSFAISSSNAQTASFAQNGNGSFSGSFSGDGSGLINIPASGITGLNLSQISSGSVSASISPNTGLQINTNVVATSFTGSLLGTASFALTASFIDGGFY